MKRLLVSSIAIAGACFVSASANAGFVQREPVTINEPWGIMGGSLTSARWSGDTQQNIQCNVTADTSIWGICFGTDAAGTGHACTAKNDEQLRVMASVGPASLVVFQWQADGRCAFVE